MLKYIGIKICWNRGKIAGGILPVGFAVVLAVGTDGLAAPFSAIMARKGTIVAAYAFYIAQVLAH